MKTATELDRSRLLPILSVLAAFLAFPLIGFGAVVRLKGGGLGCPDWPLCYGQLTPLNHLLSPPSAELQQGLEMGHRYVATLLGMVCIGMVIAAWKTPFARWTLALLGLVIFQGLLGRYTVTLKLAQWTVAAHLLFGNLCFAALVSLALRLRRPNPGPLIDDESKAFLLAFGLTLASLALGGYTSGSGASYHCPGWPLCPSSFPGMEIDTGLKHINLSHRLLAGLAAGVSVWAAWKALKAGSISKLLAWGIGLAFLIEIILGAINALNFVPVPISALHTMMAAAIVALLTTALTPRLSRP